MSFVHDESRYPILVTNWEGVSSVDDVHAFAAWALAHQARASVGGHRLAFVSDARRVTETPPEVRRAIAAFEPFSPRLVAGTWLVSDSTWIRGVVTALGWVNKSLADVHMVDSVEHAIEEAELQLQNDKVRYVAPQLRRAS